MIIDLTVPTTYVGGTEPGGGGGGPTGPGVLSPGSPIPFSLDASGGAIVPDTVIGAGRPFGNVAFRIIGWALFAVQPRDTNGTIILDLKKGSAYPTTASTLGQLSISTGKEGSVSGLAWDIAIGEFIELSTTATVDFEKVDGFLYTEPL